MITDEYFPLGKALEFFLEEFPGLFSLKDWFPFLSECHQGFNPVLGRDHLEEVFMKLVSAFNDCKPGHSKLPQN